jgi:hypothetical protein
MAENTYLNQSCYNIKFVACAGADASMILQRQES